MSAGLLIQVVVSGIAAGAVYGLVANGFALVYRLTSVLNFAHGDLMGATAFLALFAASGGSPTTQIGVAGWRYGIAVIAALAFGALAGAVLYTGAVRPFARRASMLGWIGSTVAIAFAVQGVIVALFPREGYVLPEPRAFTTWRLTGGAVLPERTVYVLGIGIVVALVTHLIMNRTSFGLATTAVASEPIGARASGLPVERLTMLAFALAGALAAIAAILGTPGGGSISARTGVALGLKGMAAMMLARAGRGPVYAWAIAIGLIEQAVVSLHIPGAPSAALGPAWKDIAPLLIAIVVLAVRHAREPDGAMD